MKKFLFTCLLTLSSAVAFAFSGSGTSSDPYLVQTADDLYAVRNNLSAYYKMTNDIDLTQWIADNYPEGGWAPIGNSSNYFRGTFDGNGYTISGLYINRTTECNGLFGKASDATVKNLKVECDITGGQYTGAIIGHGSSITLTNCTAEGVVLGNSDYHGGLVGYADKISATGCTFIGGVVGYDYTGGMIGSGKRITMERCAVEGGVTGAKGYVGGLVGAIESSSEGGTEISKCYVQGDVTATSSSVGGLVGSESATYNYSGASISDCYYNGNVSSKGWAVGGISGSAKGAYCRCYATGTVEGSYNVGGIVGHLTGVSNRFSNILSCATLCTEIKATDTSNLSVGRICGSKGSYVIFGTFGTSTENKASADCNVYGGTYLLTITDGDMNGYGAGAALKRAITYTNLGWDFTNVWDIDEGEGYPYLRFRQAMGGSVSMEDETTFNFASPTTLTPRVTPSSDEDTGVNITTKTFTSDDVTLSFGLGTRTQTFSARLWTNDDKSYGLRIYKDGTMTIATSADNMITSIAFTGDDVSAMTCSEGSISGGIWTGEAQSVTFTIGASYNRISSIDVTYKHTVLVLSDAISTVRPGIFEPGKVKYGRVVTGDYASFCLPFDIDLNEVEGIAKVYMPMEQILYNTKTQYLMMFLKEQDMTSTIKAGTPFLAKLNDNEVSFCNAKRVSYGAPFSANPTAKSLTVFDFDGQSGVLYENNTLNVSWGGTYVPTAATTGFNSFNINGSFGQHSGTLSPYRAYVMQTAKGGNSNVRGIQLNLGNDEGEVTRVFQLLSEPATTEGIYDMQGRRVFDAQQGGLYIINGKKVVK